MAVEAAPDRTRWAVVALGFACGMVGMFQTAKVSIALAEVSADLGLSLTVGSIAVTAVSVMGVLFGVQAGRVTSLFGASRTLVFALLLTAASAVWTAVTGAAPGFLAGRILEGVGYLMVCAAAPAMMAEAATHRDKGLALAVWGAFVPVAVTVMAVVGPPVLTAHGWRVLFLGCAVSALLAALAVRAAWPSREAPRGSLAAVARGALADARILYADAPAMGLAVAFMAFAAMQVGFIALQPIYLLGLDGVDLATAGALVMATTPFAILGTVVAGVLLRLGAPPAGTGIAAFLGMAAAGGTTLLVDGVPALGAVALPVLAVSGAAMFTAGGVVASVVFASLPGRARGALDLPLLSGLIVQFGNLGALVGAPILAGVAMAWTWSAAAGAMAAMAAVGIAGLVLSRR